MENRAVRKGGNGKWEKGKGIGEKGNIKRGIGDKGKGK